MCSTHMLGNATIPISGPISANNGLGLGHERQHQPCEAQTWFVSSTEFVECRKLLCHLDWNLDSLERF